MLDGGQVGGWSRCTRRPRISQRIRDSQSGASRPRAAGLRGHPSSLLCSLPLFFLRTGLLLSVHLHRARALSLALSLSFFLACARSRALSFARALSLSLACSFVLLLSLSLFLFSLLPSTSLSLGPSRPLSRPLSPALALCHALPLPSIPPNSHSLSLTPCPPPPPSVWLSRSVNFQYVLQQQALRETEHALSHLVAHIARGEPCTVIQGEISSVLNFFMH